MAVNLSFYPIHPMTQTPFSDIVFKVFKNDLCVHFQNPFWAMMRQSYFEFIMAIGSTTQKLYIKIS